MPRFHKAGSIKTAIMASLLFLSNIATAQFKLIPLGVQGGVMTGNLTSFLLRSNDTHQYLLLDAGTLLRGIAIAQKKGSLANNLSPTEFANQHIAAALITHEHLDHIAGLVVASTEITRLPVYASYTAIKALTQCIFNWKIWPNFTDKGPGVKLKRLLMHPVIFKRWIPIENTPYQIMAFPLQHGHRYLSSAYLVKHKQEYVLFFGDTGDDAINHTQHLHRIWKFIAPLIQHQQLKAILIESSYDNSQPNNTMYGHLRPDLLVKNAKYLSTLVNNSKGLHAVTLFVIHIKPHFYLQTNTARQTIQRETRILSRYFTNVILPQQGKLYAL